MEILKAPTNWAKICIAGDYDIARDVCREYCLRGLCVSVERVSYIYTGGEETGVCVTLINYPRFPSMSNELLEKSVDLGDKLLTRLCQKSYTIQTPENTYTYTRKLIT